MTNHKYNTPPPVHICQRRFITINPQRVNMNCYKESRQ